MTTKLLQKIFGRKEKLLAPETEVIFNMQKNMTEEEYYKKSVQTKKFLEKISEDIRPLKLIKESEEKDIPVLTDVSWITYEGVGLHSGISEHDIGRTNVNYNCSVYSLKNDQERFVYFLTSDFKEQNEDRNFRIQIVLSKRFNNLLGKDFLNEMDFVKEIGDILEKKDVKEQTVEKNIFQNGLKHIIKPGWVPFVQMDFVGHSLNPYLKYEYKTVGEDTLDSHKELLATNLNYRIHNSFIR